MEVEVEVEVESEEYMRLHRGILYISETICSEFMVWV